MYLLIYIADIHVMYYLCSRWQHKLRVGSGQRNGQCLLNNIHTSLIPLSLSPTCSSGVSNAQYTVMKTKLDTGKAIYVTCNIISVPRSYVNHASSEYNFIATVYSI